MLCVNRDVSCIYLYPISLPIAGSGHFEKVLDESGCTHMGRNATSNVTYLMGLHLSHARASGGDQQPDVQPDPGMGMSLVGIFLLLSLFFLILVVWEGESVT